MGLIELNNGVPVFGSGAIVGWTLTKGKPAERTLRNAALSALQAEAEGNHVKAGKIWAHPSGATGAMGEPITVLDAFIAGLRGRAIALAETVNQQPKPAPQPAAVPTPENGYTWSSRAVMDLVDKMSDDLYSGERPAKSVTQLERGYTRMMFIWPDRGPDAWAAWMIAPQVGDQPRKAMRLLQRPPHGFKPDVAMRMRLLCDGNHPPQLAGVVEDHPADECMEPTMAERMGADLPDYSASDLYKRTVDEHGATVYGDQAQTQAGTGLEPSQEMHAAVESAAAGIPHSFVSSMRPKFMEFCRNVDLSDVKKQRKAKTYHACIACGKWVKQGDEYVTVTGRRRAHLECAKRGVAELQQVNA